MFTADSMRLAYLVLLLIAVGGFLVVEFATRPGKTLRHAAAWGLIFLGVIALAGMWDDLRRDMGGTQVVQGQRIVLTVGNDGHYHLTARLNDKPVRFIVDTGASTIALSERDARTIGLDPDALVYTGQARTANGIVATAPVRIESLSIGDISDQNVQATVLRGDLGVSLLGMTYLSRFGRMSIENGTLTLER